MKKLILFLSVIAFFMDTNAQVNDPNFTPFAYGPSIGAFVCTARPNQGNMTEIVRTPVGGSSFGGVASFRQRKYYLETGLNYMCEGYSYSATVSANNTVKSQHNQYKFYSIVVPFRIAVPVQGFRCKHLPSLAFNLAYGVKKLNLQTTNYENAPLTKNVYNISPDYKLLSPSFTLAYGVEFDLDFNNALRFEPTMQVSVVNAKSAVNKTLISNFGMRVYFLFLR